MSDDLLSFLPKTFVALDLETTGLDSQRHQIIEVGAIRFTIGQVQHAGKNCLIKIDKKVPPFISNLTGITSEMLDTRGYQLEEVLDSVIEFIEDLNLVAFNAAFDLRFLNSALRRLGRPAITNSHSCVLNMARRAWPQMSSFRLIDLARAEGQRTEGAHRAMKDCELAIHVYLAAARTLRSVR